MYRKSVPTILFTILVVMVFLGAGCRRAEIANDDPVEEVKQEPVLDLFTHEIGDGDTFATILEETGIGYEDMMKILSCSSSTYDFTSVRIGKELKVYKDEEGDCVRLEYEPDKERIIRVKIADGQYVAEEIPIEYDITTHVDGNTINESLWLAGLDIGLEEELIIEMADILAWSIDFATEVRTGDSFKVLYEKRERDGQYVGIGRVLAVKFINEDKKYNGYLFEDKDGKPAYYSEDGEAMVKQFLKAPLRYNRISSGYTYARFHPVTQRSAPHRAIDYAAPVGTPVMAVGDGTVTYAGYNGGYGNYVDVRHNETYQTQYAHLSSYAKGIRYGASVVQGQVIGYVGSTGWSTGPHLHYQIKKYGTLVNPLDIDLPPGDPVEEGKKAQFEAVVSQFEGMF